MVKIHIGKAIKSRLEDRGMTVVEFSKRLKRTSQSVYHIFNSASIDTGLLQIISGVLEYDFFALYITGKEQPNDTKTASKRKISVVIEVDDIDQQKALLKVAGISLK